MDDCELNELMFFSDQILACFSSCLCLGLPKQSSVFLENYAAIYFLLAYGVKIHFKSDSQIWKIAYAFILIMNKKVGPGLENANFDKLVDLFTDKNTLEQGSKGFLEPGDSPTMNMMLLFHCSFCEYTFSETLGFCSAMVLFWS